jgi:hypothetical protein
MIETGLLDPPCSLYLRALKGMGSIFLLLSFPFLRFTQRIKERKREDKSKKMEPIMEDQRDDSRTMGG